ncbi:Glycosyltransferase involved in cell wall bisynthesis [Thermoactinomyces sp. DSM 45891]|uniref:YheC/YheD family protein n=1 Tax=Thermoactinomyces sp. DSM 45891 TaxID=1761907 RepID=UPI000923C260|nr:YheC/YheD family protein [Thermoactinomyces sp. DSM 45891]SFW99044.1 Glycosyltransferase involved in cell wall bisynthesis [Thermoactinomyces sp. DSM 45891]
MSRIGILISQKIFSDCLRQRSAYESFVMYHRFAKREGLTPIFFTIQHVNFKNRTVKGFRYREEQNTFQRVTVPIPAIIHNRVKPVSTKKQVDQLVRTSGITVFNQDNRLNKWKVHQDLSQFPEISPYLPKTELLSVNNWRMLQEQYPAIYVKPLEKSLGMDICRIDQKENIWRMVHSTGVKEAYPNSELEIQLERKAEKDEFLIQQAISVQTIYDQAVDFRIAVQKGMNGEWGVSGMVARLGVKHGIATNLAVGGKSKKMDEVLCDLKISDPQGMKEKIEKLVILAAQKLETTNPGLADLGFDIAIDVDEKIWIIEVNGRDLRITFYQAQDFDSWHKTIQRPMQYAGYLAKQMIQQQQESPKVSIVTPGNLPVDEAGSGSVEICSRQITNYLSYMLSVTLIGAHIHNFKEIPARQINISSERKSYRKEVTKYLLHNPNQIIQFENRPIWIMNPPVKKLPGKKVLFLHSETYIRAPYINPKERSKILKKYDMILVNSQYLQSQVLTMEASLSDRCHVVPLGVNLDMFPSIHDPECLQKRILERQKRNLGGKPVLLFVGRIIPQKGLHHLLEAFVEVVKQEPNVKLLVAGSSYYGKEIETEYLKKCRKIVETCATQVEWLGYVPNDQLPSIYQLADLLITPSVGNESFGLVNLEAMATGLPILSTSVGGIGEVVQDGVNGKLLSPDILSKRIEKILLHWLNNPQLLKEMGQQSRKIVEEKFNWKRVAEDLKNYYQLLMKGE